MKEIKPNNIKDFIDYYHNFHDSNIIEFKKEKDYIELTVSVFWSNKPTMNEDNSFNTNKTKMRIVFKNINDFNYNENILYDEINDSNIKCTEIDGKEFIGFVLYDMMNEIILYIVANDITYEEIK